MALAFGALVEGLAFRAGGEPPPARVGEIRVHSAAVEPGDLFVAIPGRRHDGASFIGEAVRRGARVVVTEQPVPPPAVLPPGVTWLQVPSARAALSRLAANRYGHPSARLRVIGVTGTTGKTTTTLLLRHLLAAAGWPVGLVGSLEVWTGRRRLPGGLTTPDPLQLHHHLREMVDAGCVAAVMEVSSQGIDQHRVDDVAFALGVVTNLAPLEHLEYHPTYEHYVAAKARFVAGIPPAGGVLMAEGEAAARLGPAARAPVVLFGRGPECSLRLVGEALSGWMNRLRVAVPPRWPPLAGFLPGPRGDSLQGPGPAPEPAPDWQHLPGPGRGTGPWGPGLRAAGRGRGDILPSAGPVLELATQLLGPHHALNVVAAVGAALWLGLEPAGVAAALPAFAAPRRRTEVLLRHPFTVIDDTAGRPDSIAACFQVAAALPHRRLVAVYAVRGGRGVEINYANGLQLAREARRWRAGLVVTASAGDTSPRDRVRPEEWEACLAGLAAGGLRPPAFLRLGDALAAALAELEPGDLLLLLGAQGMDAGAGYLRALLAGFGPGGEPYPAGGAVPAAPAHPLAGAGDRPRGPAGAPAGAPALTPEDHEVDGGDGPRRWPAPPPGQEVTGTGAGDAVTGVVTDVVAAGPRRGTLAAAEEGAGDAGRPGSGSPSLVAPH